MGLTFTPLRTLAQLPQEGAAAFVAERLGQLRQRALELPLELVAGESAATWQGVIDLLAAQQAALLDIAGAAPASALAFGALRMRFTSNPSLVGFLVFGA